MIRTSYNAIICILLLFPFQRLRGNEVIEVYPGDLIRIDLLEATHDYSLAVEFAGMKDGRIAFRLQRLDNQTITERPIYEKVVVRRDKRNINDSGERSLVPNAVIEGEPVVRQETVDAGVVQQEVVRGLDTALTSDDNGFIYDDHEFILSRFDNLRTRDIKLSFHHEKYGASSLELRRSDLYAHFGIDFSVHKTSRAEVLTMAYQWDQDAYRPGHLAKLKVIVKNNHESEGIYKFIGRSMSRWDWLSGTMYYFGKLQGGQEKEFTRLIPIPELIEPGFYYLRVGFNEYRGGKPQLPVRLKITK